MRKANTSKGDFTDFDTKITPMSYEKDPLSEKIIGYCFKIHSELGPGFPARIYHNALIVMLKDNNVIYESEKEFDVIFNNKKVGKFRCDLVVEKKMILETKSLEGYIPRIFYYQVLSYLKAANIKTRLLINFGGKSCDVKRLSV